MPILPLIPFWLFLDSTRHQPHRRGRERATRFQATERAAARSSVGIRAGGAGAASGRRGRGAARDAGAGVAASGRAAAVLGRGCRGAWRRGRGAGRGAAVRARPCRALAGHRRARRLPRGLARAARSPAAARARPHRALAHACSPLQYAQDSPLYAQAVLRVLAGDAAAACACSLCWPRWPAAARSLAGRQCARSPLRYAQVAQDEPRYGPGVLRVLARGAAAARAWSLC